MSGHHWQHRIPVHLTGRRWPIHDQEIERPTLEPSGRQVVPMEGSTPNVQLWQGRIDELPDVGDAVATHHSASELQILRVAPPAGDPASPGPPHSQTPEAAGRPVSTFQYVTRRHLAHEF